MIFIYISKNSDKQIENARRKNCNSESHKNRFLQVFTYDHDSRIYLFFVSHFDSKKITDPIKYLKIHENEIEILNLMRINVSHIHHVNDFCLFFINDFKKF